MAAKPEFAIEKEGENYRLDTSHRSIATQCKPEVNHIYRNINWVLGMSDYHNIIILPQLNDAHRLILSYSEDKPVDHCMGPHEYLESFPLCAFMIPGNRSVEIFTAP